MKRILTIIGLCALAHGVFADTNTTEVLTMLPPSTLTTLGKDFLGWFKDNTNFWGQQTAIIGANALYSNGRVSDSTSSKKNTFGAALDVRFPLDANGQISIGFFAAYFNSSFYDGSISTTLGKTINVPLINQPIYLFVEGGPALNLANPNAVLAQTFTGVVWKHDIIKGTADKAPWTLFVNAAVGKVTGWDGGIFLGGIEVGHKF